jgi:hypothetical protein
VNNFERNYIEIKIITKHLITIFSARTQTAEVRIICPSSSNTSFDNLDESLPCLVYGNNDDDTPDCGNIHNQSGDCQSSLFSEINSLVC